MGKFGCTQIRTSSSSSSEKKKDFFNLFLGFGISCPEAFWKRKKTKKWEGGGYFCTIKRTYLAKTLGYRGELGRVFGSNVTLAVLISLIIIITILIIITFTSLMSIFLAGVCLWRPFPTPIFLFCVHFPAPQSLIYCSCETRNWRFPNNIPLLLNHGNNFFFHSDKK